jgi:hypothetical protein
MTTVMTPRPKKEGDDSKEGSGKFWLCPPIHEFGLTIPNPLVAAAANQTPVIESTI